MKELLNSNLIGILSKIISMIIVYLILLHICNKIFKVVIKKNNNIQLKFIRSITKAVISVIFVFALGMLFESTRELSKMMLQSSALFVGIAGFAAQQVLADVISGMMISWTKPFNIGERVTLKDKDITGVVEDITIRHTVIKTFHNSKLIIPNSVINKEILENSNFNSEFIGNYLEIGVAYESDIDRAIEIMEEVISKNDKVIDTREDKTVGKAVNILVKELGESGVILKTTVWTKDTNDNFLACSEIRLAIKKAFEKNNIEIPYNKLDVHLKNKE